MTVKTIIVVLFVLMVAVLFQGLFHMLKTDRDNPENRGKVVKSLTWRIGLWVFLFAFIFVSKQMGWLEPSESLNPKNIHEEIKQRDLNQNN